jgi:hypothetical protein
VGFKWEEYFWPVSEGLLHSAQHLMRTDRTALPAPLAASGNAAFFKGAPTGHTDLYFRVPGDTAALVLWNGEGGEVARAAGEGLLAVEVPAGGYRFGLDIDSGGVLGRARDSIVVPWFNPDELTLSSLVVAPGAAAASRAAVLRAMPADLGFAAGAPLAAYAEVYGLVADAMGRVRYRARYTFAPVRSLVGRALRGTDPVSFEFERVAPGDVLVTEQLLLAPGRVPPGRYRVTLAVTDVARNVKSETVAIVVTIR